VPKPGNPSVRVCAYDPLPQVNTIACCPSIDQSPAVTLSTFAPTGITKTNKNNDTTNPEIIFS